MQKPVMPTFALRGGVAEVQPRHQVMRLFGLNRGLAAVEVGHERDVAGGGQTVGDAADLWVDPPPLLDDDDRRCTRSLLRFGQVALNRLPIGALEGDRGCHDANSCLGLTWPAPRPRGYAGVMIMLLSVWVAGYRRVTPGGT
jgi:hypothetical protein